MRCNPPNDLAAWMEKTRNKKGITNAIVQGLVSGDQTVAQFVNSVNQVEVKDVVSGFRESAKQAIGLAVIQAKQPEVRLVCIRTPLS